MRVNDNANASHSLLVPVTAKATPDLPAISRKAGIPSDLPRLPHRIYRRLRRRRERAGRGRSTRSQQIVFGKTGTLREGGCDERDFRALETREG